jgi:hypothetical protein
MQRFFTTTRLASLFGFFSAFALGCVISIGGDDAGNGGCGGPLDHNDANCVCDNGYERCNASGTDCCLKQPKPGTCDDPNSELQGDQCYCKIGYTWCTDDPNDLSCCEDPGQTSNGTGGATDGGTGGTTSDVPTTSAGTTGGPAVCNDVKTPDGSCMDGQVACSHSKDTCTPEGSIYYVCVGGMWVDQTDTLDAQCKLEQYDFSYGCVDTAEGVEIDCGEGSGTACQSAPSSCLDSNVLASCQWGKQSETDCFKQCTEIGEMGVLYDFGSCDLDGMTMEYKCLCCDEGDQDCPINGGGTSTGGGSSTG